VSVVVIQVAATGYSVVVPRQDTGTTTTTASTKEAPNPILPVGSEMAWGIGSFLFLVLLMRVWLFPKLKKGTDARYAKTRADLDDAERIHGEGAADVARYEAAIAEANADGARVLEQARQEVDSDRTAKVTAANARIAERRGAAAAEVEEARRAALASTQPIVLEIGASAAERILGVPVDRESARPLVAEIVEAGTVAG
jgi:F-type H+-transporting ATPase subunit b